MQNGSSAMIQAVWVVGVVFGAVVAAWGVFGDRARGRRRCGGCWYDMSASGLQCPECGRAAADERGLLRTRRRWGWVGVGVVVAGIGVGTARAMSGAGWAGLVPTRVVILALPDVDGEDVGIDAVAMGRLPRDWASREMKRRLDEGLLDGGEVRAALEWQGAVRTLARWPAGSTIGVAIKPTSWIGWYSVIPAGMEGEAGAVAMVDSSTASFAPVGVAGRGVDRVRFAIEVSGSVPLAMPVRAEFAVGYEGAAVEARADASEAANRAVAAALMVELSGGANIDEMMMIGVRRTRAVDRMSVEIEVEVDVGSGWAKADIITQDVRIAPWVGQGVILDLDEEGVSRAAWCSLWPLTKGSAEQDAWRVRLRGVRSSRLRVWPAEAYWSGELVYTIGELRGKR